MRTTDALKIGLALGKIRGTLDAWEESKHPRADNGQFSSGGGSGSGAGSGKKSRPQMFKSASGAFGKIPKNEKQVIHSYLKQVEALAEKHHDAGVAANMLADEIAKNPKMDLRMGAGKKVLLKAVLKGYASGSISKQDASDMFATMSWSIHHPVKLSDKDKKWIISN